MASRLFGRSSKDYAYAKKCISIVSKEFKKLSTEELSLSKKVILLQMYRSIEQFLKNAKLKKSEITKIEDAMKGLHYRLYSAGVFDTKSPSEYARQNSNLEVEGGSKFIRVGPARDESQRVRPIPPTSKPPPPPTDFQDEEEDYIPPTFPSYENFSTLPEENSESAAVEEKPPYPGQKDHLEEDYNHGYLPKRAPSSRVVERQTQQIRRISSETEPTDIQNDNRPVSYLPKRKSSFKSSATNDEQQDAAFTAPKIKSFAAYDKNPPTLRQKESQATIPKSSSFEEYGNDNKEEENFFNFPKVKLGTSVTNERYSYQRSRSEQENIPSDLEDETFGVENLQILSTEEQMKNGFDFKSVELMNPNEAMVELNKYAESLETRVQNFDGIAGSLEYVWLEEQLLNIIKALNKINCDASAQGRKKGFVNYARNLLDDLQSHEDEDDY